MAYYLRKRLEKRAIVDEAKDHNEEDGNYETVLKFKIYHGEGIDEPRPLHTHYTRYYRVYGRINPGEEHQVYSYRQRGRPNPVWNMDATLSLGGFVGLPRKFLHLEVVRFELESNEAGTSNREVLVGRTRIPLPDELDKEKSGMFQLVRLDGAETKPAGCIKVSMHFELYQHLV